MRLLGCQVVLQYLIVECPVAAGAVPFVPLLRGQRSVQCHPRLHCWLRVDDRLWQLPLLLQDKGLQLWQVSRHLLSHLCCMLSPQMRFQHSPYILSPDPMSFSADTYGMVCLFVS